ncbi:MAG TPA: hypothetical protein VMT62_02630 [Syntrophorhabdaceae bacterium]|nr:hypothetical protein [Syntrophorhabdaceae bacterium]
MTSRLKSLLIGALTVSLFLCCSKANQQVTVLKSFPLDSVEGVIAQSDVQLDKDVSSDGRGSLKVTAQAPMVVKLFEVTDLNVEDARLTYEAKIKTQGIEGQVYLEMWCRFPGKGEFFSRGLQSTAAGDTNWMTMETPFFLRKGEKPDMVKLNLVINGKGIAWIDDIRLLKGPLK